MEENEVARLEIDLKRLLLRMQGALAGASHASVSQDEMIRRWTYLEFAQNLLRKIAAELTGDEDSKRIATYEEKLNFISQMMLAGEGHRPSVYVTTENPEPQNVTSIADQADTKLKREVVSAEEQFSRTALLGPRAPDHTSLLGSDAAIRRRLGLSTDKSKSSGKNLDISKQLDEDNQVRDAIASDVLGLINTLKENSLNVQKSLESDVTRIEHVDNLLSNNLSNVKKEISRVDTLFRSTSASCRANCAMVTTVLMIWIAVYIVMKITPRPS